jgi:ADP-ribose pyrophosphatase YjhB (NUDIX family)
MQWKEAAMSHEVNVHQAQTAILRELLFKPEASFSSLQKIVALDSDHFKFHIKRLLETGYITKNPNGKYSLNSKGKEYANKLDTDLGVIERQPKSAVIIVLQNEVDEVLVQERLKHPYFGFWGYPGGKIRWGETIIEAGARELLEETNLSATLAYKGVYHEHVKSTETGEQLEDKIFHILSGRKVSGKLREKFEGGRNAWMKIDELSSIKKKYASCDIETKIGIGNESFVEKTQVYNKDEF